MSDIIKKFHQNVKLGIICLEHSQNIGNNLLKYAMSIKLLELGYSPYIIGQRFRKHNISFIENAVNCKLINNFSEINEDDYDFLIHFLIKLGTTGQLIFMISLF